MKFESKFDFHQQLYTLHMTTDKRWKPCAFCVGKGTIEGANGNTRECPDCRNGTGGRQVFDGRSWHVSSVRTVGQITIEQRAEIIDAGENDFSNLGNQNPHLKERYMMRETGIGSGNSYDVEDLFASTSEAQAEADRRNAEIESQRSQPAYWTDRGGVYHLDPTCRGLQASRTTPKTSTLYVAKTEESRPSCHTCGTVSPVAEGAAE